jgi:hypothetical protein
MKRPSNKPNTLSSWRPPVRGEIRGPHSNGHGGIQFAVYNGQGWVPFVEKSEGEARARAESYRASLPDVFIPLLTTPELKTEELKVTPDMAAPSSLADFEHAMNLPPYPSHPLNGGSTTFGLKHRLSVRHSKNHYEFFHKTSDAKRGEWVSVVEFGPINTTVYWANGDTEVYSTKEVEALKDREHVNSLERRKMSFLKEAVRHPEFLDALRDDALMSTIREEVNRIDCPLLQAERTLAALSKVR